MYRKVSLWRYDDHDNDVYDDDADYPDKKVTFPPFYYEVKFSRPVKTNGRFVFASSVLAIELEKVEENLWGKIIIIIIETSPIFWQMSNNYNFSLFMLGDKGVSILNIEY